jgi:hypothetical protein
MNRLAELNNGIEGGAGPVAVEPTPELDIPKYVSELRVIETRLMKDIEQLRGFGETILKLPPSGETPFLLRLFSFFRTSFLINSSIICILASRSFSSVLLFILSFLLVHQLMFV